MFWQETWLGRGLAGLTRLSPGRVDLLASGVVVIAAWIAYTIVNHDRRANLDYFVPLAEALLHGRLWLTEGPSWLNELVPIDGRYYVVYPPGPLTFIFPVVALVGMVDQARVSIALGAVNVGLAWWVGRGMGLGRTLSTVFALTFGFGTIAWYSAQAGSSWHIAHVGALSFTLVALLAMQRRTSPLWVGLAGGLAGLARLPTFGLLPVLLAWVLLGDGDPGPSVRRGPMVEPRTVFQSLRSAVLDRHRRRALALLLVGFGIPAAIYLGYNWARFGSPLQTGYELIPGLLQEAQYRHGFFSVVNVPRNLYAMLLKTPMEVNGFPWIQPTRLGGMSILFTTPFVLWSIKARWPDWFNIGAWLSIAIILVPILTHADPGGVQFGYRYSLDILPLLLILSWRGALDGGERQGLSLEAWLALAMGWLVNLWGMGATYWDWFA